MAPRLQRPLRVIRLVVSTSHPCAGYSNGDFHCSTFVDTSSQVGAFETSVPLKDHINGLDAKQSVPRGMTLDWLSEDHIEPYHRELRSTISTDISKPNVVNN